MVPIRTRGQTLWYSKVYLYFVVHTPTRKVVLAVFNYNSGPSLCPKISVYFRYGHCIELTVQGIMGFSISWSVLMC